MSQPVNIEIHNQHDFANLYKYIQNRKLRGLVVHTNLEKLEIITPSGVILLVMFVIFHKDIGCTLFMIEPKDIHLKNYLRDIKIREFCQKNYKQSHQLLPIDSVFAFPIWRVEKELLNDYILKASAYFKSIDSSKDYTMFELVIAELLNNVYDHSLTHLGAYIFIQFNPQRRIIELTVADLGVGIPFAINSFYRKSGFPPLSDKDCLILSLKQNFTTQSIPQNKGKGLDNVRSFINANKGKLTIFSGSASLNLSDSFPVVTDNPINFFQGTIVNLSISVDNLEKVENDFIINDLW